MPAHRHEFNKAELYQMWYAGVGWAELARHFRCSVGTVRRVVREEKLRPRPRHKTAPPAVDPTPDEIAARAAECRARHFAEKRAEHWEPLA